MLYRITNTKETIPKSTNLAGVVTTDTVNSKKLIYTGSNDVATIFGGAKLNVVDPYAWIYVPVNFSSISTTPILAGVIGCYQLADQRWAITLDRPFTGLSNTACKYVYSPAWYSLTNDGGSDVHVIDGEKGSDYNTVPDGETITPKGYQLNGQRTKLYAPVYVDATSGDVNCEVQL